MIKMLLAGWFLFFNWADGWSQNKTIVHITNFQSNKGSCIICLYDTPQGFTGRGGKPVACLTVPIHQRKVVATFDSIPTGTYAVMVVHDANNNRKFDTNILGIPKEGYGASQNNLPFAAAPRFEENTIRVTDSADTHCAVKLRYIL